MRGRTCSALIFFLLLSAQSRADTACVDPARLAHSTIGITRYFDEGDRNAQSNVVGIQGTAWFQSATNIVTVGHVATAMGLSTEDWKPLDIKEGADSKVIYARIQRWLGGGTEKLVVLELQAAFPAARSVAIRTAPLMPEDRLVTLAYPNQDPRIVNGRFVQYVTDGRLAGTALLEMYEGNNRFAVDHGASGAPVFDCAGRIAAVISTVITQIFQTPFGVLRTSTAWGTPNVVSVPVQKLMEFSEEAQ
jgi:Trypsin-like peptidase domain